MSRKRSSRTSRLAARGECAGCGRKCFTAYCDACAPPPPGRDEQWRRAHRELDAALLAVRLPSLFQSLVGYRRRSRVQEEGWV